MSRSRRLPYALVGVALVGLAIVVVARDDVGLWQLLVFAVFPDGTLFLGIGANLDRGQLHPRAVPPYNALHRFAGPVLLGAGGFWAGTPWLVAALAWAAHVAFDRALGYGLRDRHGFQRHPRPAPAATTLTTRTQGMSSGRSPTSAAPPSAAHGSSA
jgi:Domain of unknown function (DUF4260)